IRRVEEALGQLHDLHKAGKLESGVQGLAMAYGAYIGEVIRRSEPDVRWERDHPGMGAKSYPLYWKGGASFPCAWAYHRIMNGPEDNVWNKYWIIKKDKLPIVGPTTT